ncbi:MAG: bifunctional (p)ppGpp synthetase/guanosine-3',5'-bis(diphosphate) 3'-pyrophosphohydrolase [Bacteroidales bacterium]|nr:bifunctional (p)ppGpp synthetase/guanosine-3',5'-bis(diphosphate) 3'-pyrophosphohydrolase [Bacteroidales bacterium]
MYSKIGSGIINLDELKRILKRNTKNKWIQYWSLQLPRETKKSDGVHLNTGSPKFDFKNPVLLKENVEAQKTDYSIAQCCKPIPGDDVIGYFDQEIGNVVIHKTKCPNSLKITSSQGHLLVPVKWTTHKVLSFLVRIAISGVDKFGIYNDITTVISKELSVNMRGISLSSHDGIWDGSLDIYVHNTKDLNNLIMNLSKIKGVESVARVENIK